MWTDAVCNKMVVGELNCPKGLPVCFRRGALLKLDLEAWIPGGKSATKWALGKSGLGSGELSWMDLEG